MSKKIYGTDGLMNMTTQYYLTCFLTCFFCFLSISTSVAQEKEPVVQLLFDDANTLKNWGYYSGSEFPGAQGGIALHALDNGESSVSLQYDFSNGGRYVQANRYGKMPDSATHLSFKARSPEGAKNLTLRLRDQTDQIFMKNLRVPDDQWHTFTQSLTPETFDSHWGGAKDNVIHLPLKAIGIGVYEHGTKTGSIYIDKLASTVKNSLPQDVLAMQVGSNAPSATAVVGEEAHVTCTVANCTSESQTAVLNIQLTSLDQQVRHQQEKLTLAPFASQTIKIPIDTREPGFFSVEFTLEHNGKIHWVDKQGMAIVGKHPSQGMVDPDEVMGLMFVNDYQTADRIGCKFNRLQVYWKFTSRSPRTYDWTRLDQQMADAKANHVQIILTLRPTLKPIWTQWKTFEQLLEPEHIGDYTDFVRCVTQRYKDQLLAIEIGNEPDLGFTHTANLSPDRAAFVAAKLQRIAYDLIKSIAPNLPILGQSISGVDFKQQLRFSDKVLSYTDGPIFDYFAGHPYCDARLVGQGKTPLDPWEAKTREKLLAATDWLKRNKLNTDIWNTELGWALSPQDDLLSEDSLTYARMVALGIITARTVPNLKKLTWFCMSLRSLERGFSYGLFEPSGQPRLALCAYATAAGVLHHAMPIGQLEVKSPNVNAWQFHSDTHERDTIVLWTHNSQYACRSALPAGVQMIDMFGRTLRGLDNQSWQLGSQPLYLQFPSTQSMTVKQWLKACAFSPKFDVQLAASYLVSDHQMILELINHHSYPLPVTTQINKLPTITHTLAPGSNTIESNIPSLSEPMILHLQSPQRDITHPLNTNLRPIAKVASILVDGRIDSETASLVPITLDNKTFIQPLDPNIGWDGSADLSCKAWVGWHAEGIYLAFRVTDDQHVTDHADSPDFWRNDSIQLVILPKNHAAVSFNQQDRELGFSSHANHAYVWQSHPGPMRQLSNIQLAVQREDSTHVIYETLIPWSTFNMTTPQSGHILGLNFVVNDDDGKGRNYWMGLTPGIADAKAPAVYQRFVLVDD